MYNSKYDFNKIRHGINISVADLINELEKINPQAKIAICGDSNFYIHVLEDESFVSLDHSVESDWYNFFGGYDNIQSIIPIVFNNDETNNNL